MVWRKSSFSGGNGGTNCVEVALPAGAVLVRDSKDPERSVLHVTHSAWLSLLDSISTR